MTNTQRRAIVTALERISTSPSLRLLGTSLLIAAVAVALVWINGEREVEPGLMALGLGAGIFAAREAKRSGSGGRGCELGRRSYPTLTARIALTAAAIFAICARVLGTRSHIPVPMLAVGSVLPAIGLVPWLVRATGKPFAGVVLSAFLVALTKIAACIAVRLVYGPDAQERGLMSGDWEAAPVMISLFWIGTVLLSMAGLLLPDPRLSREATRRPAAA
jgi:hypothetical protein